MALKTVFFNSKNGDRKYDANDLNNVPAGLITRDGVYANPATSFQVISNGGMSVAVSAGDARVDHHKMENTSAYEITISPADVMMTRIDTVVAQVNHDLRDGFILYKEGIPAVTPQPPELIRNESIWEIKLCEITVPKNATEITQANIRDTRLNKDVCGIVTGLIEQADTSQINAQFETAFQEDRTKNQSDFDTWFNNVKDTLLKTTLVRTYESTYISTGELETVIPIGLNNYNKDLDILNVYINGFKLIPVTDFSITSNTEITLTKGIFANTPVNFQIFKCVDGADAETIVAEVANHETRITALENV